MINKYNVEECLRMILLSNFMNPQHTNVKLMYWEIINVFNSYAMALITTTKFGRIYLNIYISHYHCVYDFA